MPKVLFLHVLAIALSVPAIAQHPYLWLDSTELSLMQSKVASNSPDWLALRAQCDKIAGVGGIPYAILYPSGNAAGTSLTRSYSYHPAGSPGIVDAGYYGNSWDATMDELGACYQAIRTTDAVRAAAYLAYAHAIIQTIAQPTLAMVRVSDGMTRYAVSINAYGDLTAGMQVEVYLPYNSAVNVGDSWTISGAIGCTNMNGTFRVSSLNGPSIYFTNPDGSAATINANCTLYSVSPTAANAFGARFYMPALAKAYDWFYGDSTGGLIVSYPSDLAMLTTCMTAWANELQYVTYLNPEQNYVAGYIWGATAAYVAFNSDQSVAISGPASNVLSNTFSGPYQYAAYNNIWLAGGGNGEGLAAYGYDSIYRMLQAEYAMFVYQTASGGNYGADWRNSPYHFTSLDDTLKYMMEFVTPTLLAEDGNEYVFPAGSAYCSPHTTATNPCPNWFPTEPVYLNLSQQVFYTTIAARMSSSYAAQFQSFYNSVFAAEQAYAGVSIPAWTTGPGNPYQSSPTQVSTFLWYDPNALSSTWYAELPLMYRAWGGNYATTRTEWNSGAATLVRFLGGPTVGAAGNGKTQFDSGAVEIQAGNNRLAVFGLEEAARAADIISDATFTTLQDERNDFGNKKNSIFWAGANTSETHNQGLTSRTPPPGEINTVTSWPSSIDRAEDTGAYTYFRASHLEANNARSSIDSEYHQAAWTRELFFLRPKLVIVHDRTATLYPTDDRAMFWTFGRDVTQITADVPEGITRYDASFQGTYRGAFWSVLPSSADVTIVDHDNLHFLYRAEVRPAAMNHTADSWLAVFDAASNSAEVNSVTSIAATNADAVQFNDAAASIVAFADLDPRTNLAATLDLPLNGSSVIYIAGLTPGAYYGISILGENLTVSGNGSYQASPAGVLVYSNVCRKPMPTSNDQQSWLRHAIFLCY